MNNENITYDTMPYTIGDSEIEELATLAEFNLLDDSDLCELSDVISLDNQ